MIQSSRKRIVVISDFQDGPPGSTLIPSVCEFKDQWESGHRGDPAPIHGKGDGSVEGGYLERLPLACIKAGFVDTAEIWTHWRGEHPPEADVKDAPFLVRRSFRMNGGDAPFSSNDMLGNIQAFGAPEILCVWGLGVSEEILLACDKSFKIYNSIDAPALRIPPETSRHFDLILTGAAWQSEEVVGRHPGMKTAILPIGPDFASASTFFPIPGPKPYDIIYVAAAQHYKRHDILFNAMAKLPRNIKALCVMGYGELNGDLRTRTHEMGLDVDFIEPPGVPFDEVNRLMNTAKIGVVCGVDDGAPAILTEYMLAGLPVLANEALRCGLQYILPDNGRTASAEEFPIVIMEMLENLSAFSPRQTVLDNWVWPHSVAKLGAYIAR